MENNLTYTEALLKLEEIVEQIEDDSIMLDKLTEKVAQANELIRYCEARLRTIEGDVRSLLKT